MASNLAPKKGKGLPKRTGKESHKARRKACWDRSEKRKAARRAAQDAAHARNVKRGYSEWDLSKRKRANR